MGTNGNEKGFLLCNSFHRSGKHAKPVSIEISADKMSADIHANFLPKNFALGVDNPRDL